jgi:hypothetical protein
MVRQDIETRTADKVGTETVRVMSERYAPPLAEYQQYAARGLALSPAQRLERQSQLTAVHKLDTKELLRLRPQQVRQGATERPGPQAGTTWVLAHATFTAASHARTFAPKPVPNQPNSSGRCGGVVRSAPAPATTVAFRIHGDTEIAGTRGPRRPKKDGLPVFVADGWATNPSGVQAGGGTRS